MYNNNVSSAQLVQDTIHSDNLAVGDDFDWQFSDTGTNYSYDEISSIDEVKLRSSIVDALHTIRNPGERQ